MTKFIILTTQRTGSTLLWRFLNLHPQIDGHGEIFLKIMKKEDSFNKYVNNVRFGKFKALFFYKKLVEEFLNHLQVSADPETQAMGFKLMYNQLNPKLKNFLLENNYKIVHLIRRNYLKIVISRETAQKREFYHAKEGDEIERVKINLDINVLYQNLDEISIEVEKNRNEFSNFNYHEVYYEDFVEDRDSETLKILQFLSVSDQGLSNKDFPLKKINTDNLDEIINNFSDVESSLKESKYAAFL